MELLFKSSTRTTFAYLEEMDGKQLSQQRKIMEKQSYSSQCYQIPPGLLRYANVSAPMSSLRNMFYFWHFQTRARTAMANEVKADRLRLNLRKSVEHRFRRSLGERTGKGHEGLPVPGWRKGAFWVRSFVCVSHLASRSAFFFGFVSSYGRGRLDWHLFALLCWLTLTSLSVFLVFCDIM